MTRVCFIRHIDRPWIQNDLDILGEHFDVVDVYKDFGDIKKNVASSDYVFIWFASRHALKAVHYAKRYGKRVVTVSGGYDVSTLKGYGLASRLSTRWIPKYVLGNSNVVLAFSNSAKKEILCLVDHKDAIVSFGVDTRKFYPAGDKSDMVLTVGHLDKVSWVRKGIDSFVDTARKFYRDDKSTEFVVAGSISDDIKSRVDSIRSAGLPNLVFTGYLSDEVLLEYYQRAKSYVQLSSHEGFCSVLAEAMLCDCIPITSNAGSLPEVAGSSGIFANVNSLYDAVGVSLNLNPNGGRERIVTNFSLDKREKVLLEVLNGNNI